MSVRRVTEQEQVRNKRILEYRLKFALDRDDVMKFTNTLSSILSLFENSYTETVFTDLYLGMQGICIDYNGHEYEALKYSNVIWQDVCKKCGHAQPQKNKRD